MRHNPLETWSPARFWLAVVALLIVCATCVAGIVVNDRGLAGTCSTNSAALEWIASPWEARNVVGDWEAHGVVGVVVRGVWLDNAFVLAYSTLLVVIVFGCAYALPSVPWWSAVGRELGWWMWVAVGLDLLENAGILLELRWHAFRLAPLAATAAMVKWVLVSVGLLYAAFTAVLWLRQRSAVRDADLLGEMLTLGPPPKPVANTNPVPAPVDSGLGV